MASLTYLLFSVLNDLDLKNMEESSFFFFSSDPACHLHLNSLTYFYFFYLDFRISKLGRICIDLIIS